MSVIVTNPITDPVNVNIVSGGGSSATVLVTNSLTNPAQDIPVEVHGVPSVTLSGTANSVEATIVGIPAVSLSGVSPVSFSAPQPVDVMNVPAVTLSGSTNAVNATLVGAPLVTLYGTANSVEATIIGLPVVSLSGGSSVTLSGTSNAVNSTIVSSIPLTVSNVVSVVDQLSQGGVGGVYLASLEWNLNPTTTAPQLNYISLPVLPTGKYRATITILAQTQQSFDYSTNWAAFLTNHSSGYVFTTTAPTPFVGGSVGFSTLLSTGSPVSDVALYGTVYQSGFNWNAPNRISISDVSLNSGSVYDLCIVNLPAVAGLATNITATLALTQIL